jgi:hypothetical protein
MDIESPAPLAALDETEIRDAAHPVEREEPPAAELTEENGGLGKVLLPGEADDLPTPEESREGAEVAALETGGWLAEPGLEVTVPASGWPRWVPRSRRRLALVLGLPAVALVAAGVWLASPGNDVVSVRHMASTAQHRAASNRTEPGGPLAPSASLAGVPMPAATPWIRERSRSEQKSRQLQELLALHYGAANTSTLAVEGTSAASPSAAPAAAKAAAAAAPEAPPGYVPHEPGAPAPGVAGSSTGEAQAATRAAVAAAPGPRTHNVTPAVEAALSKPPKPTTTLAPPTKPALDAVDVAAALRAAPMAPHDEVQVLELVTQIATVVRDLRARDAQLRAAFAAGRKETAARLDDFERRLALLEAGHAVAAARTPTAANVNSSAVVAGAGAPAAMPPNLASAGVAPLRSPERLDGPEPERVDAPEGNATWLRYRVQAASPGLAMLAEIDRGGGEGAQFEVLVGDRIPGYGKVLSIGQRGTAWVVATEHGDIQ